VAPFFDDVWQLSRKLTLHLGVRYDYLAPWKEQSHQEGAFDPASGKIEYNVIPSNIPSTLAPLIISQSGFYPAGVVKPDKLDWSPRVGIAYSVTTRTVIRAGFGLYLRFTAITRSIPR